MIDGSANVSAKPDVIGLVVLTTGSGAASAAVVPAAMAATASTAATSRCEGTGGSPLKSTGEADQVPRCGRQRGGADTVNEFGAVHGPGAHPVRVVGRVHGRPVVVVQGEMLGHPESAGDRDLQVDRVGLTAVDQEDRDLSGAFVVRRGAPQRRHRAEGGGVDLR